MRWNRRRLRKGSLADVRWTRRLFSLALARIETVLRSPGVPAACS